MDVSILIETSFQHFLTESTPLTVLYLTQVSSPSIYFFMKFVQLTIDGAEFGTEVPPDGIVWHQRATWHHTLVLKCPLAALFGTR